MIDLDRVRWRFERAQSHQNMSQRDMWYGGTLISSSETQITTEMRERAAAGGRFHSGTSDVSEERDRYLEAGYLE